LTPAFRLLYQFWFPPVFFLRLLLLLLVGRWFCGDAKATRRLLQIPEFGCVKPLESDTNASIMETRNGTEDVIVTTDKTGKPNYSRRRLFSSGGRIIIRISFSQ